MPIRRAVQQDSTDAVEYQLVVDHKPVDVTAASIALYDSSGSPIHAPGYTTGVTIDGADASKVSFTRVWNLAILSGYRIRWNLTTASRVYERDMFFDVVLRPFESSVTSQDVLDLHPSIESHLQSAELFIPYLRRGWDRIAREVDNRLREFPNWDRYKRSRQPIRGRIFPEEDVFTPHNVFDPEQFRDAHISWAMAEFYRANMFSVGSEDEAKIDKFEQDGLEHIKAAFVKLEVDLDNDNVVDSYEEDRNWQVSFTR